MSTVNRWFVRCTLCLSVAAVEEQPSTSWACEICNGQIEIMGRVERDHLVKDTIRCACDGRCTSARGPLCECACGGVNHGTGRVVVVTKIVGKVPTIKFVGEKTALAQVAEFTAALTAARETLAILRTRKQLGFLPEADFRAMVALPEVLAKARKAKTHTSRMKMLAPFQPAAAPVAAAV